ncbi:MAG: allantoicase [Gemmatimonadaceae bacterium]|nr:allantoicase [Gemmatimonadaceae bacterium]
MPANSTAVAENSPAYTQLPDLASERLGGAVIAANDEFFAPKESLIKAVPPEWREGEYTERGKWMDGWETRRRRTPGFDWAIVRLGRPGVVKGVVIDTSYFTGNYPEQASIDACSIDNSLALDRVTGGEVRWEPILEKVQLKGDTQNFFETRVSSRVTHLRFSIFPDGGVARLRVHGQVVPDEKIFAEGREADLAALENGGLVISASDMHYGNPQNMIMPGRSTHMGDGWETKRRRGPGHDWTIVQLARRGILNRIEMDTDHFKGNAPGKCMLEYADAGSGAFDGARAKWIALLPETPVEPHARHSWDITADPATHVRLNIYPDGGVARLRLIGRSAP